MFVYNLEKKRNVFFFFFVNLILILILIFLKNEFLFEQNAFL
jgi:hypothetical protein